MHNRLNQKYTITFGSNSRPEAGRHRTYLLNHKPDRHDDRDIKYESLARVGTVLPSNIRLTMPAVLDQGQLGSCVSNATANHLRFCLDKEAANTPTHKVFVFQPSRLYVYWNGRKIENTVDEDSGLNVRDGCKSVATYGACPENMWKYDITKFKDQPTQNCYTDGALHKHITYLKLTGGLQSLKQCLSAGYPFVFGITVYESFMSDEVAKTGIVPMPNVTTEKQEGGHCVLAAGYDDTRQVLIV
jgi:C1A family cysteine protease